MIFKEHLESGKAARTTPVEQEQRYAVADLQLLTDKAVLYVCNVDESALESGNDYTEKVKAMADSEGADMLIVAAKLEAEIAELESFEERQMFLEDAERGAALLNVALTKRGETPMCGIPYHAASTYITKLLKAGRKPPRPIASTCCDRSLISMRSVTRKWLR